MADIQTDRIVTEWWLDTHGQQATMNEMYKELRNVENQTKKSDYITREYQKSLGATNLLMHDFKEAMKNSINPSTILNQAISVFTGNLLTMATTVIPQVIGGLSGVISEGVKWSHWSKEYRNIAGEMSTATSTLVRDEDALQAVMKLNYAGLKLTEAQYKVVSVAALDYSRIMNIDTKTAITRVVDTITKGSDRMKVFGRLGVELKLGTNVIENQKIMIERLGETLGNVTRDTKTAVESEQKAWNTLEDTVRDDIAAINEWFNVAGNETLWGNIGNLVYDLYEGMKLLVLPITSVLNLSKEIMGIEFTHATGTTSVQDLMAQAEGAKRREDIKWAESAFGGGGGGGQKSEHGYMPYMWDVDKKGGAKRITAEADPRAAMGQNIANQFEQQRMDNELRLQNTAIINTEFEAQMQLNEEIDKYTKALEKNNKAVIAHFKAEKEVAKILPDATEKMKDMVSNGLLNLTAGIWAAADAAMQGKESFGTAIAGMIKSTFFMIAQESTVLALSETAKGFARSAIFDTAGATAHFTAAGYFGAAAVAAGTAGLAMSAAGIGGGGGGASVSDGSGSSAYVTGMNPYSPSYGREEKDKGPINVNVYLGNPTDPTAVLLSTKQVQAMAKA